MKKFPNTAVKTNEILKTFEFQEEALTSAEIIVRLKRAGWLVKSTRNIGMHIYHYGRYFNPKGNGNEGYSLNTEGKIKRRQLLDGV